MENRFVVRIVSDYVKDMRLPVEEFYPDRAIGAIYYGIVKMVYASGREMVTQLLNVFWNISKMTVGIM